MQTDSNKEFDFLVKSMMENAQEEVPSRVWDSVSSRLDAAGAKRSRVVVWRWVGAVASAAAAIAIGAFILGGDRSSRSVQKGTFVADGETTASETVHENAVREKIDSAVEFAVVEKEGGASALAQSLPSRKESVGRKPAETASESSSEAEPISLYDTTADVQSEESGEIPAVSSDDTRTTLTQEAIESDLTAGEEEVRSEETVFTDPFAAMEWEDERNERNARRVSVSLSGNVQSNGSPSPTGGFNPNMAPGAAPTKSTVQEVSKESNYSLPYSIGLGTRISISPKWSVGTGVVYSRLQRTFNGIYTEVENGVITRKVNADIHNTLHYVGIPVNFYYSFLDNGRIGVYSYAGGMVEKAIRNNYHIPASPNSANFHGSVNGVQYSAALGLGIQFRIVGGLNLYFDPSLRYYFGNSQPTSIRTQMPLLMNLEAGLRFDIK